MNRGRGGFGRGYHRGGDFGGRNPRFRGGGRSNFGGSGHRGFRGGHQSWGDNFDNQWQNKPRKEAPRKRLTEEDIAVTEYVTKNDGFKGVMKSRYSDFQVSEISESGVVAKLTDLTVPTMPDEDEDVDEDEELVLSKYNLELLPMETWDKINELVVNDKPAVEKVEIDVTGMPKEHRTRIHTAVKKAFGAAVVGNTVALDDKKFVCVSKYRKGVRIDKRVKWRFPEDHVHFILHKYNCDTMEAVARLAEKINVGMRPSMMGYAGTKDRRAITSQWVSLRRVEPAKVVAAAQRLSHIRVGNFTFNNNHIKLGMLQGNVFRITLRDVQESDDQVAQCCLSLKERGFINYYGLQRFGTKVEVPTYEIGKCLLKGHFKEAAEAILMKHSEMTKLWHNSPENALARSLSRRPNDYVNAIGKMPRNIRLLYVHSYQSIIWNRCVSERLRRFGLQPVVGDIVPQDLDSVDVTAFDGEEVHSDDEESESEENQYGDEKKDGRQKPETEPKKETKSTRKPKPKVKVLNENDITSGKYSILDVILPLPGHEIVYPPNMKEYYRELLSKDGISMELKNKVKCYSMSGAYRCIVTRPQDLTHECVRYDDPNADLVLSDADHIDGRKVTGIVPDGKYKAVIVTISLPSSSYATMALRELLKSDTSGEYHALLAQGSHDRKGQRDATHLRQSEREEDRKRQGDTIDEGEEKRVKIEAEDL